MVQRDLQFVVWVDASFRERRRLIGLLCAHFKPPPNTHTNEAVQHIKSRHVRSHYVTSQLIRFSIRATDAAQVCSSTNICWMHKDIEWPPPTPLWLTVVFYLSQAKYWNACVNKVEGVIVDNKGNIINKLFGKWNEAVYCGEPPSATCVWRASTTGFLINTSIESLSRGGGWFFLSASAMQMHCQWTVSSTTVLPSLPLSWMSWTPPWSLCCLPQTAACVWTKGRKNTTGGKWWLHWECPKLNLI